MQPTTPNFALRRATALLAVLIVAGGGVGFALSRCGDDGTDTGTTPDEQREAMWNVVVLADPQADVVTVTDSGGTTLSRTTTTLEGVLDVGAPGAVLLGVAGDPTTAGLGVLDLVTGVVKQLEVRLPDVAQLGSTPFVVASDPATGEVALIDVAAAKVIDVDALAGDDPVVATDTVRLTPDRSHIAFSELRSSRTIVLDLADQSSVSLPGVLADISDVAVATITNRGDTVLVDLSRLDGTRVGTVETPPLVGLMVTGEAAALGVTADATVVTLDAAEASSTTSTALADAVRKRATDTTAPTVDAPVAAQRAAAMLGHERLTVSGNGFVAVLDAMGAVVATHALDQAEPQFDTTDAELTCVLLFGRPTEPSVLLDTADGMVLATFAASTPVDRSADGCTVARQELAGSLAYRVVGRDLDLRPTTPVLGLASDGSAMLIADGGVAWQPLPGDSGGDDSEGEGDEQADRRLSTTVVFATFAMRPSN